MNRLIVSMLLFLLVLPGALVAQAESDEPPAVVSTVTVGGLVTGVSSYALAEYGWYRGRLGYVGELFSEFAFRNWDDGSSDRYLYAGGSVGVRGSVLPGGRGLFAEVSVGGDGYSPSRSDARRRPRVAPQTTP